MILALCVVIFFLLLFTGLLLFCVYKSQEIITIALQKAQKLFEKDKEYLMTLENQERNKEIAMWRRMYFFATIKQTTHFFSDPKYLEHFLAIPSAQFMADKPDNVLERTLLSVSDD